MPAHGLGDVRAMLAQAGLRPRKRFGQHFLIDLNLMRKLAASAAPDRGDVLVEVGAGTGSLTELLLECGARVVAVEIDADLVGLLRERLGGRSNFTLVSGDALAGKHALSRELLDAVDRAGPPAPGGALKLVANLPYDVATPLVIEVLLDPRPFERLCVTVQKEVAQRFAARPGTGAYGPASVVIQSLAQVEALAALPPQAFWPRPRIASTMLRISPRASELRERGEARGFASFVQRVFQQRRKMLRAALRPVAAAPEPLLERAGLTPQARPEDLNPGAWQALYLAWRSPPRDGG